MSSLRRHALIGAALWLVACDEQGPQSVLGPPSAEDAGTNAEQGDAEVDAATQNDAGSSPSDGGNAGDAAARSDAASGDDGGEPPADAGADDDAPPTRDPASITGIATPSVKCGDTECEGVTEVCCETWTQGGWTAATCMEKDECRTGAGPLATENLVKSECDGPRDCPTGSADDPVVCCFMLQAAPHYDLAGQRQPGPGFGRECVRLSTCMADDLADADATEGRPEGLVSCSTDAHCAAAGDGLSCEPESTDDPSAGDIEGRAHVSLCK